MPKKGIILLFSAVLAAILPLSGQGIYNPYFKALFSYRFTEAEEHLNRYEAAVPEEERLLLRAVKEMLKNEAAAGNNSYYKTRSLAYAEKVLKISNAKPDNRAQVFYRTAASGIKLKYQIERKHYLSAAGSLYALSSDIKQVTAEEKANDYFTLISGLYHYYSALAAEDYPVMRAVLLLLPKGNKKHGLKLLESLKGKQNVFVQAYALYYSARIYHRDEKKYTKSDSCYRRLLEQFPQNCRWRREYILLLKLQGRGKERKRQLNLLEKYSCR